MSNDFSTLFDFLPVGAYRSTPDGRMLRANPALVRLNGCDDEAELLSAVHDIAGRWYVDPTRRESFKATMERDGRVIGFESEVYRYKSRERIRVRENAHAVRDATGAVAFYEGTVEDVTAAVLSDRARQRSESQLQQVVSLLPGAVYRVAIEADGSRRYTYMSEGVRALYGIEPAEALADGDALRRRRHPRDLGRFAEMAEGAIAADRPLIYEVQIQLDDGREKWVQVLSAPAPTDGEGRARVGLLFDITARKLADEALRESGELWKRAMESTGDGVWDWHVPSGVEVLSPACKALFGYGPEELPDRCEALDHLTHPEDLDAMRAAREAHFAGLTPRYINEHRIRCKDGRWKWILSRGIALSRDESGQPVRVIGTHTDITERKQAEALRHERDRAAADDRAKSQFLSRVSHELRTPLNAVLGFSQLLELEPGQSEKQRQWIAQVLAAGRHLLALMDDVLDLSSAQTGQLAISSEALPLQPLLAEVLALFAASAVSPGITIHDDSAAAPALSVRADRKRLLQVLSNLMSNAIKYNRPGGWVRLAVRTQGAMVEIDMADSGPGLDATQQSRLFQPFERLGAHLGPVAGTGLGLALSRQLTEAMGGRIEVESLPGQGSVFTVILPAA